MNYVIVPLYYFLFHCQLLLLIWPVCQHRSMV